MKTVSPFENAGAPGLLRRLGAMFYDSLLLAAVLFFAALPYLLIAGGTPTGALSRYLFQLYLLACVFFFFGWFWTHGGQTLGMRAWRIRLARSDGAGVTWADAGKRFALALCSLLFLGLGYLWVLHDREKLAWHDRLSGTRLIVTRDS